MNKIAKFVQDPDWKIIEQAVLEYIEPLKDLEHIDLSDTATNIKAEIRVRKQMYNQLRAFLDDIGLVDKATEKEESPFS